MYFHEKISHMEKEIMNAWAAGLFEGEGTFAFNKGKAISISVTSTDLDVLERLKSGYSGSIYKVTKRKEHWKDTYIWTLRTKEAIDFYNNIKPYLLKRRSIRGEEWFTSKINNKNKKINDLIIEMFKEGKTHREIAQKTGRHRTSVTKFLNRNKMKKNSISS